MKPIPLRRWFWLICEIISKRYIEGNGWKTVYYHYDGQGSVRQLTNKNGKIKGEYDYLPFGKVIGIKGGEAKKNQFTFTGREYDSNSGLYYYRARYMDPRFGRYTSKDPIYQLTHPDYTENYKRALWYQYCGNNPTTLVDPLGLDAIVVNDTNGAAGAGHNAILVGNSYSGYYYYSRDDRYTYTYCYYKSFDDFLYKNPRYDRITEITTTYEQDFNMRKRAATELTEKYDIEYENCATLVNDVLRDGDVVNCNVNFPNDAFNYIEGTAGNY